MAIFMQIFSLRLYFFAHTRECMVDAFFKSGHEKKFCSFFLVVWNTEYEFIMTSTVIWQKKQMIKKTRLQKYACEVINYN